MPKAFRGARTPLAESRYAADLPRGAQAEPKSTDIDANKAAGQRESLRSATSNTLAYCNLHRQR
jgi:hypothetical protein